MFDQIARRMFFVRNADQIKRRDYKSAAGAFRLQGVKFAFLPGTFTAWYNETGELIDAVDDDGVNLRDVTEGGFIFRLLENVPAQL